MPSQVATSRRLHREGKLGPVPAMASPASVPLMLAEPESAPSWPVSGPATDPEPTTTERIQIEAVGGVVIPLAPSTPAARIVEIVATLREVWL